MNYINVEVHRLHLLFVIILVAAAEFSSGSFSDHISKTKLFNCLIVFLITPFFTGQKHLRYYLLDVGLAVNSCCQLL